MPRSTLSLLWLVFYGLVISTPLWGQLNFDPNNPPAALTPPTEQYHHFNSHTKGPKTVLVIMVRPSDGPAWTNPPEFSTLDSQLNDASQRYYRASYHQTWFGPKRLSGHDIPRLVVTQVLDLPRTADEYRASFWMLQNDCLAAVRAQGGQWNGGSLDPNNFDRWVPMSNVKMISSTGLAYVGGRFAWVGHGLTGGVTLHEWGHNWGVYHANAWTVPEGEHPRSTAGSNSEYQDFWCVMGGNNTTAMFNPQFRVDLGFLEQSRGEALNISSSGTYRIHNYIHHDRRQPASMIRALVIPMSSYTDPKRLILGFGHLNGTDGGWTRTDYNRNAVTVHSKLSNGANRIDTTPFSRPGTQDRDDSSIKIGRTYSEGPNVNGTQMYGGFHITPVMRGSSVVNGQTHEWIEVVVNYEKDIPNNQSPVASFGTTMIEDVQPGVPYTLVVDASDPDGDALAFDWDFGDDTYNIVNSASQTKTWSTAGLYLVSVTVSDMKGGTTVAQTWVNVGGIEFRDPENPSATLDGLEYEYFHGLNNSLPDMGTLFPVKKGTISVPGIGPREQDSGYIFQFVGYIEVPVNDVYSFDLRSKDGARLSIGEQLVADNDGLKSIPLEATGNIALNAGKHAIRVEMFNRNGGGTLSLDWSTLSMPRQPVPSVNLFRRDWSGIPAPGVVITSPEDGAVATMGEEIMLAASVESPTEITRVSYFSNQVFLGDATSAPWSWSWTNSYGGIWEIQAVVFDAHGRSTLSDPVTLEVFFPAGGADAISLNVIGTQSRYSFPADETAGAVPRANWNHIAGTSAANLLDNDGNLTNVGFTHNTLYPYARSAPSGETADHRMMSAYRGTGSGPNTSYNFTDIPFTTYDVYVYWGAHYDDELFPDYLRLTLNGEDRWLRADSSAWDGQLVESTAATKAETQSAGSYVVFRNVTGANLTLDVFTDTANNRNRAGPAGFQIVRSDAEPPPSTPPSLTVQPLSQTVFVGGQVTFSVTATGNPDPEYQWRKDGVDIPDATSDTLILSDVDTSDAGAYTIFVFNGIGAGLESEVAHLTVNEPPPPPITELQATAVSSSRIDVSWAEPSNPTDAFRIERSATGSGNWSTLATVTGLSHSDTGLEGFSTWYYRVFALRSGVDSESSPVVSATTHGEPSAAGIIQQPLSATYFEGQQASFSVTATGYPAPEYQWRKNGVDLPGATGAILEISPVTSSSEGDYQVWVYNDLGGELSQAASLTVAPPPAGADAVSINFRGNYSFASELTAGMVPRANWNQVNQTSAENLVDNEGTPTSMSYTTNLRYPYNRSTASGESADHLMMSSYRGDTTNPRSITFEGIPFESYDVYVYWGGHYTDEITPDFLSVTLDEETYWLRRDNTTWGGAFIVSTATDKEGASDSNTLVFEDQSATSFTLSIIADTNGANRAGPSGIQIVRRGSAPSPVDLTATAQGSDRIDLNWTDSEPLDPSVTYRVERSADGTGGWSVLASVTETSYSDVELDAGTTWHYRVIALRGGLESEPSEVISATTLPEGMNFTTWMEGYENEIPVSERGPLDNPSGDGIPNLLKFAFNLPPTGRVAGSPWTLDMVDEGPERHLYLRYRQRSGGSGEAGLGYEVDGILYWVEFSGDLETWLRGPLHFEETGTRTPIDSETEEVTVQARPAMSSSTRQFLRLVVEEVTP